MVQARAFEQQAHQREGLGDIRVGVDDPIEQGCCQGKVAAIPSPFLTVDRKAHQNNTCVRARTFQVRVFPMTRSWSYATRLRLPNTPRSE
jgi:hypothetical protein